MQFDDSDDEMGDLHFSRCSCDGISHSSPKASPDKDHARSSQEHVKAEIAAIGSIPVHLQHIRELSADF